MGGVASSVVGGLIPGWQKNALVTLEGPILLPNLAERVTSITIAWIVFFLVVETFSTHLFELLKIVCCCAN